MKTIPVCEIFESIQGEGRFAGVSAVFLRTAGCNLDCSWCDSTYSLTREDADDLTVEEIASRVVASKARHLVITGGEPLLHQEALMRLAAAVDDIEIEIETNGTIEPRIEGAFYSVSPKLASAQPDGPSAIRAEVLKAFLTVDSIFKFVVSTEEDWQQMLDVVEAVGIPARSVYVMPQGTSDEQIRSSAIVLMPQIIAHGFNFSPRLQVWLWGDERGR